MGVLNVTPDSFSDGGRWLNPDQAVLHARAMAAAGADLIDLGGESTRPGSESVDPDEELQRVIPVLERLHAELDVPVSIDTSKPRVMREAVRAGAAMINDVFALQAPGAVDAAAELKVPVCLMHMGGKPLTMQQNPEYADVVHDISEFLLARVEACLSAGIAHDAIVLDPGFGFGKSLEHNIELFRAIPRLRELGFPLLVGVSRKTMLGTLTGKPVRERTLASVVAAALAALKGADILRVHDVEQTADALKLLAALAPD